MRPRLDVGVATRDLAPVSTSRRTARVAAVQVESENGRLAENLARALPWVEQAAGAGAQLILLPEFLATGYVFDKSIWSAAEPRRGPTAVWLAEHARRLRVHLGASFLEAEGDDFYNTFVLTRPDGSEAGRVRKQTPAAFEAFFTRGHAGPHVIETELGKLGVGICYENQLAFTSRLWHAHSVDLILMPHSAPTPEPGKPLPRSTVAIYQETLGTLPEHYARTFGVPVVMVNKSGPWRTPLPGLPLLRQVSRFPGLSAIADSDGRLLGQLGAEPGMLVDDVVLDPARKRHQAPECHGRWAKKLPRAMHLFRLAEAAGGVYYRLSPERRARARAVSRA